MGEGAQGAGSASAGGVAAPGAGAGSAGAGAPAPAPGAGSASADAPVPNTPRKPELLAPAGSRAAFEAAVAAGADAVYLGLEGLNARRRAENFTLADLKAACRDAHLRGRSVYLAANTLVFPGEMDDALALVTGAAEAGVDAAIVQDVGLAAVLRRELPELELHASTQMNIRGKRGIDFAMRLGMARVTLARECSLSEIDRLAQLGIDIEVFVHGALCICQSGQCFFSSMVGGRSANRGQCAQPCRLPYTLVDSDGLKLADAGPYLLSPKDLCAIDLLPGLVRAGVSSLKIEGRMKSASYVSAVVDVYRSALDRACGDPQGFAASGDEKAQLAEAFSRGFTEGYLAGQRGCEIMGFSRPNNRGVAVGRVTGFADGRVEVSAGIALERGDVLEVWTRSGRVVHTCDKSDDLRQGKAALSIDEPVNIGDRVFRVRSAALEKDCKKRTEEGLRIPVAIRVRVVEGKPLRVEVRGAGGGGAGGGALGGTGAICAFAEGDVVEAARTKAVTREEVIEHVGRLGSTPYVCTDWDVELSEGVGVGFSALHKTRSAALVAYEEKVLGAWGDVRRSCVAARVSRLDACGDAAHVPTKHATKPATKPATKRRVANVSDMTPFATIIDFTKTDIACTLEDFKPNMAIGPKLYATNSEAIHAWAALGASFVWLSPELTLHQIRLLANQSPLPLGLVVVGRQELMVSDHCFLAAQGGCTGACGTCANREMPSYLEDRKRYRFPVTSDIEGRGHIYNAVPLDVTHAIGDLLRAGVRGFAVDATLMGEEQARRCLARVRQAVRGKTVEKPSDTTTGHLFRAVT